MLHHQASTHMTILALRGIVGMKQPKRSQLCRDAQTGLHLSYVCQNAGPIPEWLFGRQKSSGRVPKAERPVREI